MNIHRIDERRYRLVVDDNTQHIFSSMGIFTTYGGQFRFRIGESIFIFPDVTIGDKIFFSYGNRIFNLGNRSYSHSSFDDRITIGNYCSIAENVTIFGSNHPTDRLTTAPITYVGGMCIFEDAKVRPVRNKDDDILTIENDVWVGQQACFSRGITISTGAIIAACSVVTKDVPPYAVVGGNPARILKFRFPFPVIEKLLASEWFNYEPSFFRHLTNLADVGASLAEFNNLKKEGAIQKFGPRKNVLKLLMEMTGPVSGANSQA